MDNNKMPESKEYCSSEMLETFCVVSGVIVVTAPDRSGGRAKMNYISPDVLETRTSKLTHSNCSSEDTRKNINAVYKDKAPDNSDNNPVRGRSHCVLLAEFLIICG
jgi:hypothetical protein